jgi:hypothetical protein
VRSQTKNIKSRYQWKRSLSLTIRYLCNPRQRHGTENAMWEDILRQFKNHSDINFAYPTTRFYKAGEEQNH